MVQPHNPTKTVEPEGDHWRYRVTCNGIGCDDAVIYEGTRSTAHEAKTAATAASGMHKPILTDRLDIRPPVDPDQERFVELFGDEEFMKGLGTLAGEKADQRFRQMIERCTEHPYGEQALIKRDTRTIIGYTGAAPWNDIGIARLEFNYRLVRCERGQRYGTEACGALLDLWKQIDGGEIFARIDRCNTASKKLAIRLGFARVSSREEILDDGTRREIYQLEAPSR